MHSNTINNPFPRDFHICRFLTASTCLSLFVSSLSNLIAFSVINASLQLGQIFASLLSSIIIFSPQLVHLAFTCAIIPFPKNFYSFIIARQPSYCNKIKKDYHLAKARESIVLWLREWDLATVRPYPINSGCPLFTLREIC